MSMLLAGVPLYTVTPSTTMETLPTKSLGMEVMLTLPLSKGVMFSAATPTARSPLYTVKGAAKTSPV